MIQTDIEQGYAVALVLTVLVEPPLYAWWSRRFLGQRWAEAWWHALLVNASSHPLAWLVLYRLVHPHLSAFVQVAIVEVGVVVWEASLLLLLRWRRHATFESAEVVVALVLLTNAAALLAGGLVPG